MMQWAVGTGGQFGMLGAVLLIAAWLVCIVAAVWILMRLTRTDHRQAPHPVPARAILDRRFMSGELDAVTYADSRRVLEASGRALNRDGTD
jgi:uncharacterized membrane protein